MPCTVHFFWKKINFHEIFQVGACPNLKDSYIYEIFLFICTRHREFGIFNFFVLSATPYCFARYIVLEKDDFFVKYFKLVHAPTWKISHYMTGILSICTRHEALGFFDCFCAICDTLMPCTVHFFGKR